MHREYNVIVHKGVDLTELERELTTEFGSDTVPSRLVDVVDPRPGSTRITSFNLTQAEAEQLRNDPRIVDVEIPPLQQPGMGVGRHTVTTQTANFQRGGTASDDLVNWGLRRGIQDSNPYAGSTTTSGDYTYSRDGTGVDIVIQDSGIEADHPDFEDADGNSRVRQIDWYDAAGISGTMPSGFYTDYDGHGTHCAGIAAGKTYGWAKNADIYAMKLNGLQGPTDPNNGISISQAFDLIRLWHIRKNDPNDPIYTGRPTVVNMSWGYFYANNNNPDSGVYRGTSWTYGDPGFSSDAELWSNAGIVVPLSGTRYLGGTSSTADAETSDMVDAGIIATIAAGNNYYKNVLSGDADYDNSVTFGGTTRFYHRKGAPWDDNAFFVGNVDDDQQLDGSDYLDRVSSSSTRGPAVNIWAPGSRIMSTTSVVNDGYTTFNYPANTSFVITRIGGTSMAAPQIAGIAALHLQANRGLSVSDVLNRIVVEDSTSVLYDTGSNVDYDNYILSNMGSNGNVAYSRYSVDVSETLTNISVSSGSVSTFLNTDVSIDVRDTVDNVSATNFRNITITSAPSNGTATVSDNLLGVITYTPTTDYNGTDSFDFTVENTLGNVSNTGTISLQVGAGTPAVLVDDIVEVQQSSSTTIQVLANDTDANVETLAISTAATLGTAAAYANGNVIYTPDTGSYGIDTFQYTVDSTSGTASGPANVTVYVNQAVAVKDFSADVDTVLGTATIPVLQNSTSYDPYFANVVALYDFTTGVQDSTSTLGDFVSSNVSEVYRTVTGSEHDLAGYYFGLKDNHDGATVDATTLVSNGFFQDDAWTVELSFKYDQLDPLAGSKHLYSSDGSNTFGALRIFASSLAPYNLSVIWGSDTSAIQVATDISYTSGVWNKLAVQKDGNFASVYLNGTRVFNTENTNLSSQIAEAESTMYFGNKPGASAIDSCSLDNIRFTKGVARYSDATYPQSTQKFPTGNAELANVSTLTIAKAPTSGTAILDISNAAILYTADEGFTGTDYLEYNVTSINPTTSANANVSLIVTSSAVPTYSNVDVSGATIIEDGSNAIFTVNTINVVDGTTIGYTISGTGITVDDIGLSSLTGSIEITSNMGTLSFSVLADNLTEGNETLVFQLDANDSAGTGTGGLSNVIVINDTSISPTSYNTAAFNRLSVDEDQDQIPPTLVRFIVNTTSVTDGTTVGYTISGTGITVDDISLSSLTGTITINGDVGSVDFYVVEDNLTEGAETLVLTLDATDSAATATGSLSDTIVLNDTSLDPGVYDLLSVNPATVNEDGSTVTFTVDTTGVVDGTTVGYTISGTGITVDDISLISLTGTITINSNAGDLQFNINADSLTEGAETLTLTLDATDSRGDSTGSLTQNLTINDTSTTPAPGTPTYNTVNFNVTDVNEDGSGVLFTVNTTDVIGGTTVGYTISGGGITVDDISLSSLTGTIGIGSNIGTLGFLVLADYITEGPETVIVTLDATDSNSDSTGSLSASVLINDTSLTPAYQTASFDVASIDENNTDTATFTVTGENILDGTTIGYTITGTTIDQISLSSLTGTIAFASDTASIDFTAIADGVTDGNQTVTLTLDATDSFGTSTGSLSDTVDIIDTSQTPVIPPTSTDISLTINQRETTVIQLASSINDTDGTIVSVSTAAGPNNGTANSTFVSESNVFYTYTPNTTFYGNDVISYFVTDNVGANSNTSNINILIYQSPSVTNDTVTVLENTSVIVNVVTNDVAGDFAVDSGTIVITSQPSSGIAVANSNGTIQYTPATSYFGTDQLQYTIADIVGGVSLPGNLDITVQEDIIIPPIPPVANPDLFYVAVNSTTQLNVTANDGAVEASLDTTSVAITTVSANANIVVSANGIVQYTPSANFTGSDGFAYTVADTRGIVSEPANVTVEVLAAPIAVDDNVTILRNQVADIYVPGNDFDPDGNIDVTTVQIITEPDNGIAQVDAVTGNILYTPDINFTGIDYLLYTINDDTGITSGPGNVVVTVNQPAATDVDEDGFGAQRTLFQTGVVVTTPVNLIDQILPKFAPELYNRVNDRNAVVPLSYFYNNPKLAFSYTKTPQQKYIGYNPSTYPSTAVTDRIPIKYSDFVGYLYYYVPFPTPRVTGSGNGLIIPAPGVAARIAPLTAYTNDGGSTTFDLTYTVEWFDSLFPVPPREAPTERKVVARWFIDDGLVSTQTVYKTSGTVTSPAIDHGSVEREVRVKLELLAVLSGPNDDNPESPNPNILKVYAKGAGVATNILDIRAFEVESAPVVTMKPLKQNSINVNIRRYDDETLKELTSQTAKFENNGPGAIYSYPPAPGRSPINTNYVVWEIQNPATGAWSDLAFGDINGLTWPASLPYDGKDGQPNYNGWSIRIKAQAQQTLNDPTETNYSDIKSSADQFISEAPGVATKFKSTKLVFITDTVNTEIFVEVLFNPVKGLTLPGRIRFVNQQQAQTYYWRILPVGAHANEFAPNDTGSIATVPAAEDVQQIEGINPICATGQITDLDYSLEVYTDAAYTELVGTAAFTTRYANPELDWYNIKSYVNRDGTVQTSPRNIDNFNGSHVPHREAAPVEVYIRGENLQKSVGDFVYVEYSRTAGDSTTATDLQYNLPNSSIWNTVSPGTRFAVPISTAAEDVDAGPGNYELFARVFFRFIDDSPAGGLEDNFEQFKLDLYENASGGSLEDTFNIRVYDNYEYYFEIVDELEVVNATFKTTNGILTSTGSGYIKWKGATIGQSYGSFPWDPYDPTSWGSAVGNPGPEYEGQVFGALYAWQYYTGSEWKTLGAQYAPSAQSPTRDLNGDARCVQREDDYFEFKNIDSTTIGGINWASGVPVRCLYRSYYNFFTNPVEIDTRISNTVNFKILRDNKTESKGLTDVTIIGSTEGDSYKIRISSTGIIGETVDISTTKNGYWTYGATKAVVITKDSQDVTLGTFNNQGFYHPNSETETVAVETRAGSAATTDNTLKIDSIVVTNAPPTVATTRSVVKPPGSLISKTGNVSDEGATFNLIANYKNLPDSYNMRLTVLGITSNGASVAKANWGDYVTGVTWTGTDSASRLYKDLTPTYPHAVPNSAAQRDKTYTVQQSMQCAVQPDTSGDITIKVVIAATVPDNAVRVEETFTFKNTTPPPWIENLSQLYVVASKYSVKEGDTVRFYIKDKATSTDPQFDNWNDVTPIPFGTTVYAKVGGQVGGTVDDFTTDPAPTIVANGITQVIELSIRSDGNAGPVDVTFETGDGVEFTENFELRCAFNESDLTPATNFSGSGFVSVADSDTPPVSLDTNIVINSDAFGSFGQCASVFEVNINGDITIAESYGNPVTSNLPTTWLNSGNAEDYDVKFNFTTVFAGGGQIAFSEQNNTWLRLDRSRKWGINDLFPNNLGENIMSGTLSIRRRSDNLVIAQCSVNLRASADR